MDQDLYEADEADKFHVRLSSSGPSTSKVPSRAAHGADVDMDVLSLVRLPVLPQTNNTNKTRYFLFKLSRTEYTLTSHTMLHTHNA